MQQISNIPKCNTSINNPRSFVIKPIATATLAALASTSAIAVAKTAFKSGQYYCKFKNVEAIRISTATNNATPAVATTVRNGAHNISLLDFTAMKVMLLQFPLLLELVVVPPFLLLLPL